MLYTKFGLNWPERLRRSLKYENFSGRRTDERANGRIYTHTDTGQNVITKVR